MMSNIDIKVRFQSKKETKVESSGLITISGSESDPIHEFV